MSILCFQALLIKPFFILPMCFFCVPLPSLTNRHDGCTQARTALQSEQSRAEGERQRQRGSAQRHGRGREGEGREISVLPSVEVTGDEGEGKRAGCKLNVLLSPPPCHGRSRDSHSAATLTEGRREIGVSVRGECERGECEE